MVHIKGDAVKVERRSHIHSHSHNHSRSKDAGVEVEMGVEEVVVVSSYSSLALYHNMIVDVVGAEKSLVALSYPVNSCERSQYSSSHSSARCLCLCCFYLASLQTMALPTVAGTLTDNL